MGDPRSAHASATLFSRPGGPNAAKASGRKRPYTPQSLESLRARIQQESHRFFNSDPWLAQSLRLGGTELDLSRCDPRLLASISPTLMKIVCVVAAVEKRPITSLKLPPGTKVVPEFVEAMGDLLCVQIRAHNGTLTDVPMASLNNRNSITANAWLGPGDSGTYINRASQAPAISTLNLNDSIDSDSPNGRIVCDELSKYWIHLRQQHRGGNTFSYAGLGSPDFLALNRHLITQLAQVQYLAHYGVADACFGDWLATIYSDMEKSEESVRHYVLQIGDHAMALEVRRWVPPDAHQRVHYRLGFYDPNHTARHLNRWATSMDALRQWHLGIFTTTEGKSPWEAYLPSDQSADKVMQLSQVPSIRPGAAPEAGAKTPLILRVPADMPWGPASIGLLFRTNDLSTWKTQLGRIKDAQGLNIALQIMFARSNGVDAYLNYNQNDASAQASLQLLQEWGLTPGAICHQLLCGLASVEEGAWTCDASASLLHSPAMSGRRALDLWYPHLLLLKDSNCPVPEPGEVALLLMPHLLWSAHDAEDKCLSPNDAWARLRDAVPQANLHAEVWVMHETVDVASGVVYPPFYCALAQCDINQMEHLAGVLGTLLLHGLIKPEHLPGLLAVQIRMPDGTLVDLREQMDDDEAARDALKAYQQLCQRLSQSVQASAPA